MKYLLVLILNYLYFRPNDKFKWIVFAFTYLAIIALLYFTDSINYWWFKWIVIPLFYVLIVLSVDYVVRYIYRQVLAISLKKLREDVFGMDFSMVPAKVRNRTIERFLNDKCKGYDGKYDNPIINLDKSMQSAANAHYPAYYNAAMYYYCYVKPDYMKARACCSTMLTLLQCRSKDDIYVPIYKWVETQNFYDEMFDKNGMFLYPIFGTIVPLKMIEEQIK